MTFFDREPIHDCCGLSVFKEPLGARTYNANWFIQRHLALEEEQSKLQLVLVVARYVFIDGPGICRTRAELETPRYVITDYHRVGEKYILINMIMWDKGIIKCV